MLRELRKFKKKSSRNNSETVTNKQVKEIQKIVDNLRSINSIIRKYQKIINLLDNTPNQL